MKKAIHIVLAGFGMGWALSAHFITPPVLAYEMVVIIIIFGAIIVLDFVEN